MEPKGLDNAKCANSTIKADTGKDMTRQSKNTRPEDYFRLMRIYRLLKIYESVSVDLVNQTKRNSFDVKS